jgi:CRISPR system Cascade subunit CasE
MLLSRATLRRDTPLASIAPLLLPEGPGRAEAGHRLVWTLFGGADAGPRDFLWRDEGGGRFMILSPRPPDDPHGLFEIESKPFEPALAPGDRLDFVLRANATRTPRTGQAAGRRRDVATDAVAALGPSAGRAERHAAIAAAGAAWFARVGTSAGFAPVGDPAVDGDEWRVVPRRGASPLTFASLDFSGVIEVTDPAAFVPALGRGFGRAKAFGCGLMLIRRAKAS